MTESRPDAWCRLDAQDRIIAMGGEGVDGSTASAGPDAAWVGSSLYDHVLGHFTRRFLKEFLDRARKTGAATRSTYRCDTPQRKILVEMRALLEPDGSLLVTHSTLESQPLPFAIAFQEAPRGVAPVLERCSICNRVKPVGSGAWREPEAAAQSGQTHLVVHTACRDCRKGISARKRWHVLYPILPPAGRVDLGPAAG